MILLRIIFPLGPFQTAGEGCFEHANPELRMMRYAFAFEIGLPMAERAMVSSSSTGKPAAFARS